MTRLADSWLVARKDHHCDGHEQLDDYGVCQIIEEGGVSEEKMYPNGEHMIRKGDKYNKQIYVDGGTVVTWKSCELCYGLLGDFKLWADD